MDINIDDRRSIREIVVANKEDDSDIRQVLECIRIKDETGVRLLTVNIIRQAIDDIESLYKRTIAFYEDCNPEKLTEYYTSNSQRLLPFSRQEDSTALEFFDGEWGKKLMESLNLRSFPAELKEKLNYLSQMQDAYHNHCVYCLRKIKTEADKRKSNHVSKKIANASK